MRASAINIAPPKVLIPATKAAHKQSLFRSFKDLVAVSLAYTINYQNDPAEQDFIHYLDDVVKTLPMDEQSVAVCALLLFRNMVNRSEKNPLRVVELVDGSLPAPEPVVMHSSDGTFTMIEQVKSATKLTLTSNTAFEFKGNTPALLPVSVPYTLTFTPTTPKPKSGPEIPAMSYDVLESGYLKEREVPLTFTVEDDAEGKAGISTPEPMSLPILSTSGTTEQAPVIELSKPATHTELVESIPLPEISKSDLQSQMVSSVPGTIEGASDEPQTSAHTSTDPDLFPSIRSSSTGAPAASIKATNGSHVSSQLPNNKEDYQFAVNHFPPHPHAADGRPPIPGGKVGLQRSYAFTHKSHPEIFWNNAWGEKPSDGQAHPVEDHSQPLAGKQKQKVQSDKPSRRDKPVAKQPRSPVRVPSSGSATMRAVRQMTSMKRGRKRAREEVDADADEGRPNQRRRAGTSGDAGMSGGADTPKRLSHRLSDLKKAVMNIAETAFTR